MPPCAQSVADPNPRRVLQMTVTRDGASRIAAIKPAIPAPTTTVSLRWAIIRSIARRSAKVEHAHDRRSRTLGNGGIDRHLVLHRL